MIDVATKPLPHDDVSQYHADFPALAQQVHGRDLVYLDNAATTQLPHPVLQAMADFLARDHANTHGRIHALSERSQNHLQQGRQQVADFIGAGVSHEVVFVPGATYGLNLVAQGYFASRLGPGDTVVVTVMEHHSNFVPWQQLCEKTGASLVVIDIDDEGQLDLCQLKSVLKQRPKCLAVTHVSNVLGTINPLQEICALAHAEDVLVVVDGAQAVGHMPVNVVDLGADFYVFSGHKHYAPTGIGVVYARAALWQKMQPWVLGGGMVGHVSNEAVSFAAPPECFEAGTKNVLGVVGLTAAMRYLKQVDLAKIATHEQAMAQYLYTQLQQRPYVKILGGVARTALVSFVVKGAHPHDVVMLLDQQGVAARGGHHCAQPLMQRYGVVACTRISCAIYTTRQEIDACLQALDQVCEVLHVQ